MSIDHSDEVAWPAKQTAVRKTRVRRTLTNQQKVFKAMVNLKKRRGADR